MTNTETVKIARADLDRRISWLVHKWMDACQNLTEARYEGDAETIAYYVDLVDRLGSRASSLRAERRAL